MAKNIEVQTESFEEILEGKNSFIVKHGKNAGIVVGVIVVAILAVLAYFQLYANPRKEKSNLAIGACQEYFQNQTWDKALNGDGQKCIGFLAVIDQFGGTDAANLACAYAGKCYYEQGKVEDAIKMLEKFSPASDKTISPMAVAALGNCYATKGENAKGAELLEKAANMAADNTIKPTCLMQAADLYIAQKQMDKAKACYEEIKNNCKNSPYSQDIDKYLENLEAAK